MRHAARHAAWGGNVGEGVHRVCSGTGTVSCLLCMHTLYMGTRSTLAHSGYGTSVYHLYWTNVYELFTLVFMVGVVKKNPTFRLTFMDPFPFFADMSESSRIFSALPNEVHPHIAL